MIFLIPSSVDKKKPRKVKPTTNKTFDGIYLCFFVFEKKLTLFCKIYKTE